MNHQEFRKDCRNWLEPLGAKQIYTINHPTDDLDRIDFNFKGVRVICKLTRESERVFVTYSLHREIFNKELEFYVQSQIFFNKEELQPKLKRFKLYIKVINIVNKFL